MENITAEHVTLFKQNERLVHYCLTRLNLYPSNANYDDYYQLAAITFLVTLANYPYSYTRLTDWQRFVGYVSQKIHWTLLDELRKAPSGSATLLSLNSDQLQLPVDPTGETFVTSLEVEALLADLLPQLTEAERHLFHALYDQQLTMTEYSRQNQLSRTQAYARRKSLQQKYQRLLDSEL